MKQEPKSYYLGRFEIGCIVILAIIGIGVVLQNTLEDLRQPPQSVRVMVIPAPGSVVVQLELGADVKSIGQKLQGQLRDIVVDGRIYTPAEIDQVKVGDKWAEVRFNLRDGSQVLMFKPGKEVRHAAP